MSDQFPLPRPHDTEQVEQEAQLTHESRARTGNHVVDRVLDTLDTLPDTPVDEHVAIFEQAHAHLRGALDGPRLLRP